MLFSVRVNGIISIPLIVTHEAAADPEGWEKWMLSLLFVKVKKNIYMCACVCLLLKGEEDTVKCMKNPHVLQTRGRRRDGRVVLGAKYKFTGREFWLLGTSTSGLALPAAAKVSSGCQAELAAHLPVLLLHLQDLCPHAMNRSCVQLMIVSRRRRRRKKGWGRRVTGLPSVPPPAPLVARCPAAARRLVPSSLPPSQHWCFLAPLIPLLLSRLHLCAQKAQSLTGSHYQSSAPISLGGRRVLLSPPTAWHRRSKVGIMGSSMKQDFFFLFRRDVGCLGRRTLGSLTESVSTAECKYSYSVDMNSKWSLKTAPQLSVWNCITREENSRGRAFRNIWVYSWFTCPAVGRFITPRYKRQSTLGSRQFRSSRQRTEVVHHTENPRGNQTHCPAALPNHIFIFFPDSSVALRDDQSWPKKKIKSFTCQKMVSIVLPRNPSLVSDDSSLGPRMVINSLKSTCPSPGKHTLKEF